jgi:hypothetical protein
MTTRLRIAALTSAVAVAAASVLTAGLPASAATTTIDPGPGAAGWLAAQFQESGGLPAVLGAANPDPGFTIDGILALASAGAAGDQAQKAIQWLQEPGVATGFYGSPADPAKLAKLIFGAQVAGVDPTSFGSGSPTDLVALLLPLQDATTGAFTPSTFGQSFAVMALKRAGHGDEADAAAAALVLTQCTNGGWTFDASFDPTCQYVDADDTSLAVQALLDAGAKTDPEKAALQKGLDYLTGSQLADHGWSSFDVVGNANSTGLAIQALRAADVTDAADAATTFLRTLQVGCGGPAGEVGAFGYDPKGYDASTALFATVQGILGLGGPAMWQLSIDGADADAPTLVCASPTTATSTATGSNAILPVTGSPLTGILVGGAALVAAGVVLLVVGRLRRNRAGA